jgi:hypothetical protein
MLLGRPRQRWEVTIKINIKNKGRYDLINVTHNTFQWRHLVNKTMNLRDPQKMDNFLTNLTSIIFSERTLLHGVTEFLFLFNKNSV